jgi:peptidoglycan-associated lipoprotein
MNIRQNIKYWLLAGLLALFLSACATTEESSISATDGDGAPIDAQDGSSGGTSGGDSSGGAEATGLGSADSGAGTPIADGGGSAMSATAMLEQTDGDLADRTIYFEYDSAALSSESIAILETHGNFLATNGEVTVRLEGHTDERGSREYNIALGDRRAQSVRRVLLFQGASSDQIETVSYGEEEPAVAGHDEAAWSKNRRVELIYKVN